MNPDQITCIGGCLEGVVNFIHDCEREFCKEGMKVLKEGKGLVDRNCLKESLEF